MATILAVMVDEPSHFPYRDSGHTGWTLHVSHSNSAVVRLVVFVHGYDGDAVKTWADFPKGPRVRPWWGDADLLFVAYRSMRETIKGTADRLRDSLPRFYPRPLPAAMGIPPYEARVDVSPYRELILVGHSLGGVVLRKALSDCADAHEKGGARHPMLDAKLRLFSPAHFGYNPAGKLAALKETGSLYDVLSTVKGRWSPAYRDLQPDSEVLRAIRRRTERLSTNYPVLRANILWAEPDHIVVPERYDTDLDDYTVPGQTHVSVCKPRCGVYEAPWDFAQTGAIHG